MTERSHPNDVMGHIDRESRHLLLQPAVINPITLTRWPFPYLDHAPDPAPCTDVNRIAGARILIADDYGELLTNLSAYLARQNLSVVDPPNRRQAIVRQIQEIAPEPRPPPPRAPKWRWSHIVAG